MNVHAKYIQKAIIQPFKSFHVKLLKNQKQYRISYLESRYALQPLRFTRRSDQF